MEGFHGILRSKGGEGRKEGIIYPRFVIVV